MDQHYLVTLLFVCAACVCVMNFHRFVQYLLHITSRKMRHFFLCLYLAMGLSTIHTNNTDDSCIQHQQSWFTNATHTSNVLHQDLGGGLYVKTKKTLNKYILLKLFFFFSFKYLVIRVLLIESAIKLYDQYLYGQYILEETFGNIKVTQKVHLPFCYKNISTVAYIIYKRVVI